MSRALVTIALAFLASRPAPNQTLAQDQKPAGIDAKQQARHPGKRSALDLQVSRFARNLELTESQQSAVRLILEQQQQEILKIRQDPSLIGGRGIDRIRTLQENTVMRIRSILNEEQKKRYDPLAPRRLPPATGPSLEDWLNATAPH